MKLSLKKREIQKYSRDAFLSSIGNSYQVFIKIGDLRVDNMSTFLQKCALKPLISISVGSFLIFGWPSLLKISKLKKFQAMCVVPTVKNLLKTALKHNLALNRNLTTSIQTAVSIIINLYKRSPFKLYNTPKLNQM